MTTIESETNKVRSAAQCSFTRARSTLAVHSIAETAVLDLTPERQLITLIRWIEKSLSLRMEIWSKEL
jgi:hypothetical protein